MKPIYFPGTYVPRWVAQALAACFKHFIVYWPSGSKVPPEMQNWVEEGVMEIRLPAQIEEPAVKGVIENFRSFASLYRNGKEVRSVAFLKQQADAGIRFFRVHTGYRYRRTDCICFFLA